MAARTIENCSLIKRYRGPKPQIIVKEDGRHTCEGFQRSYEDDEPCNVCMECKLNTFYEE